MNEIFSSLYENNSQIIECRYIALHSVSIRRLFYRCCRQGCHIVCRRMVSSVRIAAELEVNVICDVNAVFSDVIFLYGCFAESVWHAFNCVVLVLNLVSAEVQTVL